MVVIAGSAFVCKLIEFIYTATTHGGQALASFLIPVLNYLMVAAGFLLLFIWAYLTGQFRDVENPKYRMLDMQDEIDGIKPRKKQV
ncbi:MAG: cbb3-type cytochrome oxidase assembly protein [Planctomycetes bacterium]|nr:cbb3-type cytochrome oxidase assembly protein [Planctomycetota bacterium]